MIDKNSLLNAVVNCLRARHEGIRHTNSFPILHNITIGSFLRGTSGLILVAFDERQSSIISISVENIYRYNKDTDFLTKLFCAKVQAQLAMKDDEVT